MVSRLHASQYASVGLLALLSSCARVDQQGPDEALSAGDRVQWVIDRTDRTSRERTVYMIGRARASRLAELVREKRPDLVVECGTALGYSGLWIARELEALGQGRLVTIEIDPEIAAEARRNFEQAGLSERVEVITGDACKVLETLDPGIDFLFIDCNYENYYACLLASEPKLEDGALIVADNVGLGVDELADYLGRVRSRYESTTEWFELDLPWADRDAMEVTRFEVESR